MEDKLVFIEGKKELVDEIEELWKLLNLHHMEGTEHFKDKFAENTFERRKKSLLDKSVEGDMQVLIVKDAENGRKVGYCVSTINKEQAGEIDSLYVEKEYRCHKLGDQLMNKAITWLESKDAKEVVLTVAGGNEGVLNFYRKFGFYTANIKLAKAEELPTPEGISYGNFFISADKSLIQLAAVTEMLGKSYWAAKRSREIIKRSIENSLCFGVYDGQKQIGFARVITDYAIFAYLCDVIIDDAYKGKGIGKALMEYILGYDKLKDVSSWSLKTKDAHSLYEKYGFKALPDASIYMVKTK